MNTFFKVILEGPTEEAAIKYLYHDGFIRGDHSMTERGKQKDKEEHTPLKEAARLRLRELLDINYPEFVGRFRHVYYHVNKDNVYVAVNRAIPEQRDRDIFAE